MTSKPNPFKHIYNSATWKRLRAERLALEPLCRMCKAAGRVTPAYHVDHIQPLTKGGDPYEWDNTQSLCVPHHSLKTRADEGATVKWGCDANGNPLDPASHWHSGN